MFIRSSILALAMLPELALWALAGPTAEPRRAATAASTAKACGLMNLFSGMSGRRCIELVGATGHTLTNRHSQTKTLLRGKYEVKGRRDCFARGAESFPGLERCRAQIYFSGPSRATIPSVTVVSDLPSGFPLP